MTSRAARCAAIAAWTLCVQAPLLGSDQPGTDSQSLVAPNQSVALTDPGDDARPIDAPGEATARSTDTTSTTAEPAPHPAGNMGTRMLRRRDADARSASSVIPESTPWYRSGLGALLIVLALMVLIFYILRRYVPSMRAPSHGAIRIVARTALTPKHSVALIRLGRRFVLVGVSGDHLTTLVEVSDAEEVGALAALVGGAASPGDFAHALADESMSYDATWDGAPEPKDDTATGTASRPTPRGGGALAQLKSRLLSLQSR